MPYSGADDKSLPANVKKASPKDRRQWVGVFNSVMSRGGSEADAFKMANGVLNDAERTSGTRKEVGDDVATMLLSEKSGLEGSVMDLMSDVREQLNEGGRYLSIEDVILTPTTHIIACDWMSSDTTWWNIPYTIADNGEPVVEMDQSKWTEVEVDYVPVGTGHYSDVDDAEDYSDKAELTSSTRKKMPKSSFAYVDEDGKGHFPIQDAAHVRNALARLSQSPYGDKARPKVMAAAKRFGIKVSKKEGDGEGVADGTIKEPSVVVQHESTDEGHKVVLWLKSKLGLVGEANKDADVPGSGARQMVTFKQADGRTRFVTWYSNCYKDKHGEIIATTAHKAYADWANANQTYPEMWLWHTKGTRWGQVDHLIFDDGLMMATGLVDPGRESWAEQLAQMDTGFSHGFAGLRTKEGIWTKYVDLEISGLPRTRAANEFTPPMNLFAMKEEEMALDANHKDFFRSVGLTEDEFKGIEGVHENFAKQLKAAGIEYKEDFKDDKSGVAGASAEGTNIAPLAAMIVGTQKAVGDLAALVQANNTKLDQAIEASTKANQDMESRVKEAMTPRNVPGAVTPPSQSDENVVKGGTKEAKRNDTWFFGIVDKSFESVGVPLGAAAGVGAGTGAEAGS